MTVDNETHELLLQLEHQEDIPNPVPELDCQFYESNGQDILLGAKTDFFHPVAQEMAAVVLELLELYPKVSRRCRILTKFTSWQWLDRPIEPPQSMMIGTTISATDTELSDNIEPGAAKPMKRLDMLKRFSEAGYKTWLVIEPYFKWLDLPMVIAEYGDYLDELWIGRLNGNKGIKIPGGALAGFTLGELAQTDDVIIAEIRNLIEVQRAKGIVLPYVRPPNIATKEHELYGIFPQNLRIYPKKEILRKMPDHELYQKVIVNE